MTNTTKFALIGVGLWLLLRSRAQAVTSAARLAAPQRSSSSNAGLTHENEAGRLLTPTNDLAFYYVPPPVGFAQPVQQQTTIASGASTAQTSTTSQPPPPPPIIPPGAFDFSYEPGQCGLFCFPPGGLVILNEPPPPPVEPSPASQSGSPSTPDPPPYYPDPILPDYQNVN